MLDGLIRMHVPEQKRALRAIGGIEHHLTEGAVMVSFAIHLLGAVPKLRHVALHPDGEHAKHFDFAAWLMMQGFARESAVGRTTYGGLYASARGLTILINPKSGVGDVVADIDGQSLVAECKGGVINSTHAGHLSRLRKVLCETVGLSLATQRCDGLRQFAVVPKTLTTAALAKKISTRSMAAGVEIALIDGIGNIEYVI
jgi:hypothetical protein